MKFKKIKGENVLALGAFSIELDDRGLILLQGENVDNSSATSNGAGKSSIPDALCWAIYGTTARDVSGDKIVNNRAKKNTYASVMIEDDGFEYTITRHRKHATNGNSVIVHSQNIATGELVDLTKGTDKETQEVINKIIGCGLDVFMSSIYAGQERMPDLPGMTDKQLKLLLEEAAGVEILADASAEVRSRHNIAKTQLAHFQTSIERLETMLESTKLEADKSEVKVKEFEDGRKGRAQAHLLKIKPIMASASDEENQLATFDEGAIKADMEKCRIALAERSSQDATLKALNAEVTMAERHVATTQAEAAALKRQLLSAKQAVDDVDNQVGKSCGECGKTYCEHDLEVAKKARAAALEAKKGEVAPIAEELKRRTAALEEAKKKRDAFEASMTDTSEVAARSNELAMKLRKIEALRASIASHKASIETHRANAKAELTAVNPWKSALEVIQKRIDEIEKSIIVSKYDLSKKEAEVALLTDAVKVFGPAGVRAHILDTVTPFLNEQTAEYLGALSDGNLHAVWSTLSRTAKGELKEKFNIEVSDDTGADTFAGLSGGEKRKVRLACAMALQDMVASRATKPLEMFIADEIDHALDEAGLERLMGVLDRKARERGTVIVISHQSLSDWIPNVITVTKKDGFSTLSGATARGF